MEFVGNFDLIDFDHTNKCAHKVCICQVTQQVLQICHMRTSLKRKRSRAVKSSKNVETGKSSKKQKMLFLARSQAAHRRRMMDIFRECGSILKQVSFLYAHFFY